MNNFEFDDIIRRKFESAKFGDPDASFSKIKGELKKRRYYFYFTRSLPYAGMLLLGIGIGYFINDLNNASFKNASEQRLSPIKESILTTESKINSSQWKYSSGINNVHSEIHSHTSPSSGVNGKNKISKNNSYNSIQKEQAGITNDSETLLTQNTYKNTETNASSLISSHELTDNSTIRFNEIEGSLMNEKNNIKNDTVLFKNKISIVTDSAARLNNPPLNYFKEKKNVFYLHVFGGYSFGWQKAGIINARGIIPDFGIIYERTLPENLFFRTGINLTMMRDLKNCVNTFTIVETDTRYRQTVWEFKTPVVYYLRMPLVLGLKNNSGKNFIHFGFLVNFLMNSKNEVTKYSFASSQQYKIENITEYGYAMDGFNRWNSEFTVGFRRRLNKNLRIGIDLNHHITNVIRNYSFFNNQQNNSSKAPSVYAGIEYKF